MSCKEITTKRTWCRNKAQPGKHKCAVHENGPAFAATYDDYMVADLREWDGNLADRLAALSRKY